MPVSPAFELSVKLKDIITQIAAELLYINFTSLTPKKLPPGQKQILR